jgi:hypothetical protein
MVHSTVTNRTWKAGHFSFTVGLEDVMKTLSLWVLLAFLPVTTITTRATKLPFIQDDFARARAEALQRKRPIFVECWAPW